MSAKQQNTIKKPPKLTSAKVVKKETALQAVVVAESFDTKFAPITLETPRCLIPVMGVPVINYTLNVLTNYDIYEVVVFCCSHTKQIRDYISSIESNYSKVFHITVITSEGCLSMGDALREIETKGIIKDNFILLYGDTLSNLDFQCAIDQHIRRTTVDKQSIMTVLYRDAAPEYSQNNIEDEYCLLQTKDTQKIVYYQRIFGKKSPRIPVDILKKYSSLDMIYGLIDCHVFICTPFVLQLLTDNFDIQTIDEFVKGILVNEEILGNTIYTHIALNGYSSRISSPVLYLKVCRDLVRGCLRPLTVNNNFGIKIADSNQNCRFKLNQDGAYISNDVQLGQNVRVANYSLVSSGSCLGDNCSIMNSVIGRNCTIGDGAQITGCSIWDDVVIGNDCHVKDSILANGTIVGNDVVIEPRCVISYKSVIRESIPEQSMVTSLASDTCYGAPRGDRGNEANFWIGHDEDDVKDLIAKMWGLCVDVSDDSSSSEDDSDSEDEFVEMDDTLVFYEEVLDSLSRALEENISKDNLVLEINSSKYAYNMSMEDINVAIVRATFKLAESTGNQDNYCSCLTRIFSRFASLYKHYWKKSVLQIDLLNVLTTEAPERLTDVATNVFHFLYESDIIEEDAILNWFDGLGDGPLKVGLSKFVDWLKVAEEESDDD